MGPLLKPTQCSQPDALDETYSRLAMDETASAGAVASFVQAVSLSGRTGACYRLPEPFQQTFQVGHALTQLPLALL